MLANLSRADECGTQDAPFTTVTIYAGLQLIILSETARAHRHTAFAMRFIIEGSGKTRTGDKEYTLSKGDKFCISSWYPYQQFADPGPDPCYLYRFDDKPMLTALEF
ncbi:hypothetical protein GQ53DRAFT_889019 [Thozetella sp. PMI_491]|nr:hypothetical protein GQ53DRAFT_889019 [Thozetella sp. PMI_491]